MTSFIRTPDHLTIVFDDGDVETVYPSHPKYDDIVIAINEKRWDDVKEMVDPVETVRSAIDAVGVADLVEVRDGEVLYDGKPMHNYLTTRMLEMLDEGFDIRPLMMFLQNLMENPSFRAVNELYGFLESSNLPITEDGHFLAYKRIRSDWTDVYTGTMDNSIGQVVSMPRNEVDEDKNRTCSRGLHFCAREYLKHYGSFDGGRVVVVKINPKDVVAIPSDYNNAKGRACRYEIIQELDLEDSSYYSIPFEKLEGAVATLSVANARNDSSGRVVVQLTEDGDEIDIFDSPTHASRATGIDPSGISKAARGIRNTAGGYHWEYRYL